MVIKIIGDKKMKSVLENGSKQKLSKASNDAAETIGYSEPYIAEVEITGACPMLFHRWSCEDVEIKSKAAKNSKAKKTDNVESYVWRNPKGELCVPGEYLRQSIIHAAKFKQDPRSPRKSAMDLFKAGTLVTPELASLGTKDWDFLDKRRVTIQRNGITRTRPAMMAGWHAKFQIEILLPEYIDEQLLQEVVANAGRLIGVGDFRPTYGRFNISKFEVL